MIHSATYSSTCGPSIRHDATNSTRTSMRETPNLCASDADQHSGGAYDSSTPVREVLATCAPSRAKTPAKSRKMRMYFGLSIVPRAVQNTWKHRRLRREPAWIAPRRRTDQVQRGVHGVLRCGDRRHHPVARRELGGLRR